MKALDNFLGILGLLAALYFFVSSILVLFNVYTPDLDTVAAAAFLAFSQVLFDTSLKTLTIKR